MVDMTGVLSPHTCELAHDFGAGLAQLAVGDEEDV